MRDATYLVLDNTITGTGTWYSAAQFNRLIGKSDYYAVQTYATNVSGTATLLTVSSEMSADSQNWVATGATEISNQNISTLASAAGSYSPGSAGAVYLAANARLKITLTGPGTIGCRLKLYVTSRCTA